MPGKSLDALASLLEESRIDLPSELPPMAAGLFGYFGYDIVRQVEELPDDNPDQIGIPDSVFIRPTIIAVFDNVADKVTLVTPVWPPRTVLTPRPPTQPRNPGLPIPSAALIAACREPQALPQARRSNFR